MFFSISIGEQNNFSHFNQFGPFHISTDAGWHKFDLGTHQGVYKGYAVNDQLENLLPQILQQDDPELFGNFCVLTYDHQTQSLKILTDRYRSFPIYIDDHLVTNLETKPHTVWTDSKIVIKSDWSIQESKFDVIGAIDPSPVTVDQALAFIDQRLSISTQKFLSHNTLPINVFLSGGVDSMLVYSYLQRYSSDYQLVRGQHFEYDKFWLMNSGTVQRSFWGYSQFHHWTKACVLSSGAPGDEFMLRSPSTCDLFLKFYQHHVIDLLRNQWQDCLHHSYFSKQKHLDIFNTQQLDANWDVATMMWNLCNIVVNDWQHWHLGETLTWTPLRDLEIFKMLLRLPVEQAMGQIFDSKVSLQLIENNKAGLGNLISDQKNSGNPLSNLCDFVLTHPR